MFAIVLLFGERLPRRYEAQHHDVAHVRPGLSEIAVSPVQTVQHAQNTETIVEPKTALSK